MNQKLRQDNTGFGKVLRALRKKNNLTQEAVAKELQLRGLQTSRASYAQIECGTYNIRITELLALKEIYKVKSFDEFFEGLSLDP